MKATLKNSRRLVSLLRIASLVAVPIAFARAQLPPSPPQGVSVINADDNNALRSGILDNPDIDMISLQDEWDNIQSDECGEDCYDFTNFNNDLAIVANSAPGRSALWRIPTMGGAVIQGNNGNTPNWVFTDMGVAPNNTKATPGVTYSFTDASGVTRCIPVFGTRFFLRKRNASSRWPAQISRCRCSSSMPRR